MKDGTKHEECRLVHFSRIIANYFSSYPLKKDLRRCSLIYIFWGRLFISSADHFMSICWDRNLSGIFVRSCMKKNDWKEMLLPVYKHKKEPKLIICWTFEMLKRQQIQGILLWPQSHKPTMWSCHQHNAFQHTELKGGKSHEIKHCDSEAFVCGTSDATNLATDSAMWRWAVHVCIAVFQLMTSLACVQIFTWFQITL